MTPFKITCLSAIAIFGSVAFAAEQHKTPEAVERIDAAKVVFEEIMNAGDSSIPKDLLEKAHCVAIVPGLKKAGFIVGGQYGKGVLMCRRPGGGWTGPGTIRLEGGSFGLQIGAGEVDMVLLVMNESGAKKMVASEFKIGANASAMAGPVGRSVDAATDALMRAELLGYSRSRGVFAGVTLEGSTIRDDVDDNAKVFGKRLSNEAIVFGKPGVPATARPLVTLLNSYSTWEK